MIPKPEQQFLTARSKINSIFNISILFVFSHKPSPFLLKLVSSSLCS